ncbi:FAD-binding oxidoreductase [Simiduia agarivorans]|uniref:FAD linked oxidase domain-containing protein n=1 Tax=Simiduia agarivorans (strain DSM 21679 / JCM 13881 / BCRC 17597 / SA1) TaxID=1117647 RepID=K4KNH7_SIMAS|nr:FAD-binding oxidoreductase [Simiduia agarivorans]AFV00710.1 FAD linked oxidase domain-containing protein [Simiduia agarivorans SA1 = DSM 21679]
MKIQTIHSWGRLTQNQYTVFKPTLAEEVPNFLHTIKEPVLAIGLLRSYGDACLNNQGPLLCTTQLDHLIAFDTESGILHCGAGVTLGEIQRLFAPKGWMLAVTPGTQFVTVGGAIANDVHGKNHHKQGTFGRHALSITLARTDRPVLRCSQDQHPDLFAATIGGIGLTGIILSAEIQLKKITGTGWLTSENIPFSDLNGFYQLSEESEGSWEHTVAWFDCLSTNGRGIFSRSNYCNKKLSPPSKRNVSIPFTPPISPLNGLTVRIFNELYYNILKSRARISEQHYSSVFYPLDHISNWNRMYGNAGFYQYQCVIPEEAGIAPVKDLLNEIRRSSAGSFLAVLKKFGSLKSPGLLSFPIQGTTIALDFPNKGKRTLALFERLDNIVRLAEGKLYSAKDARGPKDLLLPKQEIIDRYVLQLDRGINSDLARRILPEEINP